MGYEERAELPVYRSKWSSSRSSVRLWMLICVSIAVIFLWLSSPDTGSVMWKNKHVAGIEEEIIVRPAQAIELAKYDAPDASATVTTTLASPTPTGVLEVFQVYQPVLTPEGITDETTSDNGLENTTVIAPTESVSSCQLLLMEHSFGFSYGMPFVGNYVPPNCKFNRVVMNFTVTSRGRQFDRLALMFFNDTEVFRTSTAEPTVNGIVWTYMKDMTQYLSIWNSPQTLIFDLGNLIDSTYTGPFNTTLTATFFNSQETVEPAALILPVSTRQGSAHMPSYFSLPEQQANNTITLPRNANRAVFAIAACGQATEEFWWGNVLQSDIATFEPYVGTLYGYSPWREVQLYIDGKLAGVAWPFPIIFTGGVVPGLWRPIVGIDAFDLREYEIDITPWLGLLSDGKPHTFEIKVAGIVDNGRNGTGTIVETVGSSWYVSGKIFLWLDSDPKSITRGANPVVFHPSPEISISQYLTTNSSGANETLTYTTNVQRSLTVSATIHTQKGIAYSTWSQSLAATNYGQYISFGATQFNIQSTKGTDQASNLGSLTPAYKAVYSYPLTANTTYLTDAVSGNYSISAWLKRGLVLDISGASVFPTGLQPFASNSGSSSGSLNSGFSGTTLSTSQNGSAEYFASPSAGTSSSFGSTTQSFKFAGVDVDGSGGSVDTELYTRDVTAVNGTVVYDHETLRGGEVVTSVDIIPVGLNSGGNRQEGLISPKEAIGRGWGNARSMSAPGSV
ncbi:peptide N-acetyl-beta-D-glucosaminyl asparaginase amidase A-domain-containing protein [Xylogone sp. PMI_703]|nr:peptide N-acetyl-beta-D-glucosaminyl asparaginase amidase A-domain-containing protein [Xylogone sp. PMI_703]